MGESRTELLQWLNDLLQLNYTKIEQCGTGAAYCQIIDSIYGDVPLSRVKFTAKHEYEFLANFKVLQNVFKQHKVDRPIPVDRLVKCKMQDNLEFLQWARKYWEQTYSGQEYNASARRKGAPADPPSTIAPLGPSVRTHVGTSGSTKALTPTPGSSARGRTPLGGGRVNQSAELQALQTQVGDLTTHLEGLEKERDFYFDKLRQIEILAQAQTEVLEAEGKEDKTLKEIQAILYSTEEGFEVPEANAEDETF